MAGERLAGDVFECLPLLVAEMVEEGGAFLGQLEHGAAAVTPVLSPVARPLRILVADDVPVNQKLLQRMLEKLGPAMINGDTTPNCPPMNLNNSPGRI